MIEHHRSADGSTVVVEALYSPRAMRCADDWHGRYADGSPKANRTPCLVGRRIERGQPHVRVYASDGERDRTYHAECYIRTYRIVP